MPFVCITVGMALGSLRRHTMRSLLTTLGIVIGVAAVIIMTSIGKGASAAVQEQIARLGHNMLIITPGSISPGGVRSGFGGAPRLWVRDARAIRRECPAVHLVTYMRRQVMQVIAGNQNWSTAVFGVTPEYQRIRDWPVAVGRFLRPEDEQHAATVAVLGHTVVENLFPGQDPLERMIRINNVPLRVVGVLSPKGQSPQGSDQDDTILIPFSTAERRVQGTWLLGAVSTILVSVVSPEAIPEAITQITMLLRQRHRLKAGQNDDFTIRNLAEIAATAA